MNNRKYFLTHLLLIALTSLPLIGAEIKKPNIILIMADDVGIEAFSSYGGQEYKTPHLDKMVRGGMQFNHCYSQPLCTPSRVRLMTGESNAVSYLDFSLLDPKLTTIGHRMMRAGYQTGICGKWQLYGAKHYKKTAGLGTHPSKAGFHSYRLWQIDQLGSRYHDPLIIDNGKPLDGKDKYGPDLFADFALNFIRENKERPFFLYYPMVLVHDPFVPTPDSSDPRSKDPKKNFSDMMTYMDKIVGKIITEVKTQGLEKNTLILFLSDNGTHQSIVSKWNNTPRRGGKGMTTDAGTHVPLYAYWPGKIKPNSKTDSLVCFSDFQDTLVRLAGERLPDHSDDDSNRFTEVLHGDERYDRLTIYVYSNPRPTSNKKKFLEVIFARNQRYKLYSDGRFYDVKNDLLEENNILKSDTNDAPEIRLRLAIKLDSMPETGENLINKKP